MKSTEETPCVPVGTRARGRPPRLSRHEIVREALALVRRRGRESLTMRSLAEELGCGPMSLYSHVRDKAELLDAVGALALDRVCAVSFMAFNPYLCWRYSTPVSSLS